VFWAALAYCEGREEIRPTAGRSATSISLASLIAICVGEGFEILDDQHKGIRPADHVLSIIILQSTGRVAVLGISQIGAVVDDRQPVDRQPLMVNPVDTAWSRASVTERPELLVPSPEMSMMRRSTCHFDLANCATAKSMPELIEVRPMKERGAEGGSVVGASACAGAVGGIALRIAARSPPPAPANAGAPPARRHRRSRPRCGVSLIQKGADRLINHGFTHFRDLLPSTASLARQIATRRRRLRQIRPSPPMAPAVTRIHSGLMRVPRMRPAAAPVIAAACHPLSAARANT
jgi:hypothetical protein